MADAISGGDVVKAVGHLMMVAVGVVLPLLTAGSAAGSALTALFSILGGVCALVFSLMYRRYVGVLGAGAKGKGNPERKAYDALRVSLAGENLAARLYADWLKRFLDAIERFFGDAGTVGQRAFWLKKPAPLWTAPAFDRCLLLALIYPIATILLIWAVSGHVGPAEAVFRLEPYLPGWRRGIAAGTIGFLSFALWRAFEAYWRAVETLLRDSQTNQLETRSLAWAIGAAAGWSIGAVAAWTICNVIGGGTVAAGGGADTLTIASGVTGVGLLAFSLALAFLLALTVAATLALVGGGAIAGGGAGAIALTIAVGGAVVGPAGGGAGAYDLGVGITFAVAWLSVIASKHRWQGIFLALFLAATFLLCLAAADLLSSPLEAWRVSGPWLLFVGLLTLLNAPFDWASLGLTRALLRRGLELGGWWPYVLALVDAVLAGVIIACLALVMVIGVQTFDELAMHGGGAAVLPLDNLFDGIAKNPAAPEYWWVYALLLSSLIPNLINLMIGGLALTRGIPGLPSVLINFMPTAKAVPGFDRAWMALVLTGQIFVGAVLGIAAQAFLAWGVIFHVMPQLGLDLLDMARAVAAFDLPARVAQLFIGLR